MLIHGIIDVQDLNAKSSETWCLLRSCLFSKLVNNIYYLCVKNSMYPNCITYRVAHLDNVYTKEAARGKISLLFKRPKHRVVLLADNVNMLNLFLHQLHNIIRSKNVVTRAKQMLISNLAVKDITNRFSLTSTEFVAIDHFDRRILNIINLNKLVLENCVLPNLPEQIGDLPLAFLSLSGSTLGASQYERDTLWDWMSVNTINQTLKTLHMDSINLMILPFEILFLKNLETLSISNNKLMYLPHYIGDLKKLQSLFIADNRISYLPQSLKNRDFINLDISNNKFMAPLDYNHIDSYMKLLEENEGIRKKKSVLHSLSHLSFSSVVENCIKFKRQELPRTLWHYFNIVGRCTVCHKVKHPQYCTVLQINGRLSSSDLGSPHSLDFMCYQIFVCRRCVRG